MDAFVGEALLFTALYIETKVGKTGLTVTVDVYRNGTKIIDNVAATEQAGGLYRYDLASGSNNAAGRYTAIFKTATSTVDQQHIGSHFNVRDAMGPLLADSVNASALNANAVTEIVTGILTTAMTESYSALGATKTLAQALYEALALLGEKSISGTTMTTKRVDGDTNAATYTLNSSTTPTAITRAS